MTLKIVNPKHYADFSFSKKNYCISTKVFVQKCSNRGLCAWTSNTICKAPIMPICFHYCKPVKLNNFLQLNPISSTVALFPHWRISRQFIQWYFNIAFQTTRESAQKPQNAVKSSHCVISAKCSLINFPFGIKQPQISSRKQKLGEHIYLTETNKCPSSVSESGV